MFKDLSFLANRDGARLAYRFEQAQSETRGIVLISHGLCEHSGRYLEFAKFLSKAGFHVYAHDHRGHGATTAADAPRGRFALKQGAQIVVEDMKSMYDLAKANHPGLPVLLFGHSMGGLIALATAIRFPDIFQALAIWNSNFSLGLSGHMARLVLKIERALKGSDVPSLILPKATFESWGRAIPNHKTLSDWLTRDQAEVEAYRADPLCSFSPSISMWLDVLSLAIETASDENLQKLPKTLPIQLTGGGEDPATDKGLATKDLAARLQKAGLQQVKLTLYPDMRHETLKEFGRESAMHDFARWAHASFPILNTTTH